VPKLVLSQLLILLAALSVAAPGARADTVLITGANSGIGLELATQYAADGWHVIATHRRELIPDSLAELANQYENVQVETIDVTNIVTIQSTVEKLDGLPIDLLINNAAIVGQVDDPALHFGTLDYDRLHQFFDVNAAGPLRVSEAFYSNVLNSDQKKIVAISSVAGSPANIKGGLDRGFSILNRYPYNMSKAALNAAIVHLAANAEKDGVAVAAFHPGLVRVARTENYDETMKTLQIDVHTSVEGLQEQFAELDLASSGSFISYDGKTLPW